MMKSKAHTIIAQLKIQVRDPIDVRIRGYIFSLLNFVCFSELFNPSYCDKFSVFKGAVLGGRRIPGKT